MMYFITLIFICILGTSISYSPGHMTEAAAYGEVSCQQDKCNGKKVTASQVIITVKQVVIPGAMDSQSKPLSEYGEVPFQIAVRLSDLRTANPVEVKQFTFTQGENTTDEGINKNNITNC